MRWSPSATRAVVAAFALAVPTLLGVAAGPIAVARTAVDYGRGQNPWLTRALTREELLPAIAGAADFFVRNELRDGQFAYIKDPLGNCCLKKRERYSLIRHLGGVYALLRAYEQLGDRVYLDAAKSGIDFAARFRGTDAGLQVVKGLDGAIDLGENGFLLITMALYDELAGTRLYAAAKDDLAAFLGGALIYDGPYATDGQWAECQGIIGLAYYYKLVKPDPTILRVTSRWLAAMMAEKKASHWSVQAIRWVGDINPNLDPALLSYGVDTARGLLKDVVVGGSTSATRYVGSRNRSFNSCGVTARNEGLIAGYALARRLHREADASFLLARIKEHIAFALQFQYGMPGNLYENNPKLARVGRLFDLGGGVFDSPTRGHIRVDYVSHHVRAITAYLALPNVPKAIGLKMDELSDVDLTPLRPLPTPPRALVAAPVAPLISLMVPPATAASAPTKTAVLGTAAAH